MIERLTKKNIELLDFDILSKEQVLKELNVNPYANYLVYIENNKIIAYLYYSFIYDRTEINMIEVKKEERNKKIGTKLLKQYLEITKCPSTLEVNIKNLPAIGLYKKYGYKKVAIREKYYNGVDGILMERK
ncbi:MAG: GNAT family N-acetyltransferase [Bacilli bacterium]|nr:GNAT family N-acetyltransferase [Bacilli bacterium]